MIFNFKKNKDKIDVIACIVIKRETSYLPEIFETELDNFLKKNVDAKTIQNSASLSYYYWEKNNFFQRFNSRNFREFYYSIFERINNKDTQICFTEAKLFFFEDPDMMTADLSDSLTKCNIVANQNIFENESILFFDGFAKKLNLSFEEFMCIELSNKDYKVFKLKI